MTLQKLKIKLKALYDTAQEPNWDGYDAEPLRFLREAYAFADWLFSKNPALASRLELNACNDGGISFSWWIDENNNIDIEIADKDFCMYRHMGEKKSFLFSKDDLDRMVLPRLETIFKLFKKKVC